MDLFQLPRRTNKGALDEIIYSHYLAKIKLKDYYTFPLLIILKFNNYKK